MNQESLEGQVNAGCLLFMHRECPEQLRKDTADCILYTQLAASKKHDRFSASVQWNDTWRDALVRFGYALETSETLSLPASERLDGSIWEWLAEKLPPFMSAALLAESQSLARRSLLDCPDPRANALFARQVLQPVPQVEHKLLQRHQKVVIQIGMLGASSELMVAALTLTCRKPFEPDLLFQPLAPESVVGNIEMRFYSMQLMERVYSQLRAGVQDALAQKRSEHSCALQGGKP